MPRVSPAKEATVFFLTRIDSLSGGAQVSAIELELASLFELLDEPAPAGPGGASVRYTADIGITIELGASSICIGLSTAWRQCPRRPCRRAFRPNRVPRAGIRAWRRDPTSARSSARARRIPGPSITPSGRSARAADVRARRSKEWVPRRRQAHGAAIRRASIDVRQSLAAEFRAGTIGKDPMTPNWQRRSSTGCATAPSASTNRRSGVNGNFAWNAPIARVTASIGNSTSMTTDNSGSSPPASALRAALEFVEPLQHGARRREQRAALLGEHRRSGGCGRTADGRDALRDWPRFG
jgi:hypothetical protein